MLQYGLHAVLTLHITHPNSCAAQHKVCYKESIMVWVEDVVLSSEECLLITSVIITIVKIQELDKNVHIKILKLYFYVNLWTTCE